MHTCNRDTHKSHLFEYKSIATNNKIHHIDFCYNSVYILQRVYTTVDTGIFGNPDIYICIVQATN